MGVEEGKGEKNLENAKKRYQWRTRYNITHRIDADNNNAGKIASKRRRGVGVGRSWRAAKGPGNRAIKCHSRVPNRKVKLLVRLPNR
jgi:hypothetical protein